MKKYLKELLSFCICVLICFVVIYLFVFFGGWKLFASGDAIGIEIAVSVILGIFLYLGYLITDSLQKRLQELEKRILDLEKENKSAAKHK